MITVESVEITREVDGLLGCFVDAPAAGSSVEGHVLRIVGWVLGRDAPVQSVEVGSTGHGVLGQVGLDRPRPDITEAFGGHPHSGLSGFDVAVSLLGAPPSFTLWVVVTDATGVRRHIASVLGRRTVLQLPAGGGPAPVMVTTLGRTGSTWLTQLLGAHPEVLALDPFRLEPRVVSYWAEVCRALCNPSSYLAPLLSAEPETDDWWLGRGRTILESGPSPELERWLSSSHVSDVATFCRDRIEALYRTASEGSGAGESRRFVVEKLNPTWVPNLVWELFPDGREIVLVRDFRDRLASVIDFNRKRGYDAFGRAEFATDEDYVRDKVRVDATTLLSAWHERRDRALLVRYEDLVLEPHDTAEAILAYLGLPADAASVRSLVESSVLPDDATAGHRTSVDAVTSIGRWRRDLDVPLQRVCQEELDEVLAEFGYDVDEHATGAAAPSSVTGTRGVEDGPGSSEVP